MQPGLNFTYVIYMTCKCARHIFLKAIVSILTELCSLERSQTMVFSHIKYKLSVLALISAIRLEIQQIEDGKMDRKVNPLKVRASMKVTHTVCLSLYRPVMAVQFY